MDSLYIVIPAYNEEESIEGVVRQWYPLLAGKADSSRLVIADSGSTDGTHDILTGLQREFPKLVVLSETLTQHGPKLIVMYRYASDKKADYIFQTDSDGQTDPAEFGVFWDARGDFDAILGNRQARGDGRGRAFVERVVCLLLLLYFGIRVPDANAPFRLMRCSLVEKYIDRFPSDYALPNIMLTTYFAYYHERLSFKNVSFKPRQGGVSSVNIPKIVHTGWRALSDFRAFKRAMDRSDR